MNITGLLNAFFVVKPRSFKRENQTNIHLDTKNCTKESKNVLSNGIQTDEFSVGNFQRFLILIDDNIIQQFLMFDRCYKLADNYLLAMVFIYFIRARLPVSQYDRINFFAALYLAHDVEEDDEDLKCHIMRWGLGRTRKDDVDFFLGVRDRLWKAMDFRACVSVQCCLQVMRSAPDCSLWHRTRSPVHSGATRSYEPEQDCVHCQVQDIRFYGTDLESDGDIVISSDEEEGVPPIKRMKLNEE